MHAQQFALAVLSKLTTATEDQKSSLIPIIRSLDLIHPEHTDAAVNQLLQHSQEGGQAAKQVFKTLQKALAGSSHAPMMSTSSTLALAIDAPSAELRIAVGLTNCYKFNWSLPHRVAVSAGEDVCLTSSGHMQDSQCIPQADACCSLNVCCPFPMNSRGTDVLKAKLAGPCKQVLTCIWQD